MILVDANLLIYAIDRGSAHHRKARVWLENILSNTTPVGLAWIVVLAFLRVTTRSVSMSNPLPADRAIAYVDSWLAQSHVPSYIPEKSIGLFCGIFCNRVEQAGI